MKITTFFFALFLVLPIALFADSNKIIISEFMAVNSNGIVDEDLEHSDWLELYNATDAPIYLAGWYLSDNAATLKEWQFPSITIPKGGYLVVFASGKNRIDPTKNLHTNFKLSGSGEFLAISEPDTTISSSYAPAFPAQRQDISYGLFQGQPVYFSTATPSAQNVFGSLPFAPNFSAKRGFYKTAFEVTLTLPGGDGAIYYSTNGLRPTKTTGTLYTAPIHIATTTPLSAITINAAGLTSEIISNTYTFLSNVVTQPAAPAGYPTNWKQLASATAIATDYAMDPDVCNSADYKNLMETALTSIPTINIVTTIGNLFSDVNNATTGGIYIYTGKPSGVGVDWVRPTSVEYFDPATNKDFQLNCQLKLHGGNSRNPSNCGKHGFELGFKSAFGPSKLNFNLFDEKKSVKEFNSLILRGGYNYSWTLLNTANAAQAAKGQYIQDSWAKTTQLEMGHPSGHERFVHVYLNGLYWGMYNIAEDYSDDFMESYFGGDKLQFDVIKEQQYNPATYTTAVPTAGDFLAWKDFVDQVQTANIATNVNYQKVQGKNADGTVNAAYSKLLEPENYIDYMLINYYLGNLDWDKNNWTVARNRVTNDAGFRFFCWDAETTMTAIGENIIKNSMTSTNPANFMQYLVKNADFKVLLADKIQKSMLNTGGALSPSMTAKRYSTLADEINFAIIAESARWGDGSKGTGAPYTKNDNWTPRKQDLLTNYFPFRTDTVIKQLRDKGFFTTVQAPVFTHQSDTLSAAINLGMTTNTGTIYYTTDGSDPRAMVTGAVATGAKTYAAAINIGSTQTVKARAKSSTDWSPITEATFVYNTSNGIDNLLAVQLACGSYPNPFSNETQIHFTLPDAGNVQVDIYGIDGRLVKNLYSGLAFSGYNQLQWTPSNNESGLYICKISYAGQSTYLKLMRK